MTHAVRVFRHNGLVDADASVMVNIAWLGQPNNGVNEDIRLALTGCQDGQFAMSAVHRVAGLKGNNFAPSKFVKVRAKFCRCV